MPKTMTIQMFEEDERRMREIAEDCGRVLKEPYVGNQDRIERYLWALSVLGLHIARWIIRRERESTTKS